MIVARMELRFAGRRQEAPGGQGTGSHRDGLAADPHTRWRHVDSVRVWAEAESTPIRRRASYSVGSLHSERYVSKEMRR